jgi:hypothetical protein
MGRRVSVGRAFGYSPAAKSTVWALTLPQVAATLAAAIVAYGTQNAAGQRMRDPATLNAVLVVTVATSILGPILTERFAPHMLDDTRFWRPRRWSARYRSRDKTASADRPYP